MSPKRSRSAATRSTASSTGSTSSSRARSASTENSPAADPRIKAARPKRNSDKPRFAWALTGSGHMLEESLALARTLPNVDLYLSAAAAEVLPLYKLTLDSLKRDFRVFNDNSRSSVPVGLLYADFYHTVVVAPATSNTVAKCAFGISDTLPTNMFAQAGKLGIPGIVYACDTEPVVITRSPREWVELRPRKIELENVER
ncbi:MAG TPA: flavoprotein, partial [Burkholderiales bacterium]|nr:flavoprotein [Burkholderiales bacterium]